MPRCQDGQDGNSSSKLRLSSRTERTAAMPLFEIAVAIAVAGLLAIGLAWAGSGRAGQAETPPRSRDWSFRFVILGLFVIGALVSIAAAVAAHRAIAREAQDQFNELCESFLRQTVDRIERVVYGLNGLRGMYAAGVDVDRAKMKAHVSSRDLPGEFPGVSGMGFIQRVAAEDLDEFIRTTRADGEPTYAYKPLRPGDVARPGEHDHYMIKFVFPYDDNRPALGCDIGTNIKRRVVIEKAIDTGKPTITPRLTLIQAPDQTGFVYFVPVYKPGSNPASPDERRRSLVGVLFAPVVLESVIGGLIPAHSPFHLTLMDLQEDSPGVILAVSGMGTGSSTAKAATATFTWNKEVTVGGRPWRAEFHSTHAFETTPQFLWPPTIGVGGMLLTAVVCALLGVVGSSRDRAARTSERKARVILDQTFEFIGLLDRDGRVLEANQASLEFAGIRANQVIGKFFPDTPWWQHSSEIHATVTRAIHAAKRGEFVRFETVHPDVHGELHHVDFSLKPVFDERGEVVWLVPEGRDITELKNIQEAHKAAKEAAESASRFKTEFLANMSHEIRTPLTAILGFADVISETIGSNPAGALACVTVIKRNGDHLMCLINDILDLSKIEAGQMTIECLDVDTRQLLIGIDSLKGTNAQERRLDFSIELLTDIPTTIRSDPLRIKQILINLVSNAVKFTERGGVTLGVGFEPDTAHGSLLTITVADTGIGIAPEQLSRLFEAFQQADTSTTRKFGGTGLGLRIAKSLATMLGGDLTVTSELGKGSRFTVSIPTGDVRHVAMIRPDQWRPRIADRSAADDQSDVRGLAGVRIFVAEDSPPVQQLIKHYLVRAGAVVRFFPNGLDAIRGLCIDENIANGVIEPLPCDLLLTDIQMTEMDGYTLARTLRAKGSTLPIIALTAHTTPEDAIACMSAGCTRYATKPIDFAALIEMCRETVQGHTAMTDADVCVTGPSSDATS